MYKHYRSILAGVLLFGIAAAFLLFQGCKKQDKSAPGNNNDSGAKLFEYVGVIVGSSGRYKVEVDTNGATAFVIFDDHEHRLSVLKKIEKGKDIDSLVMKDDVVTVVYSYKYATQTPSISITIKGHDVEYTVATLYDHRHPQYAQDDKPLVRLYEGKSHSTYGSDGIYDEIYNMSIDGINHTCEVITKCTASNDPSQIGETVHNKGSYNETDTTATIGGLYFTKVGDDYIHEESGDNNYYFYMYLKYVSF